MTAGRPAIGDYFRGPNERQGNLDQQVEVIRGCLTRIYFEDEIIII